MITVMNGRSSVRRMISLLLLTVAGVTKALTTDMQVYPPILIGSSGSVSLSNGTGSGVIVGTPIGCVVTQTLAVHSFGYSYGVPFVCKIERSEHSEHTLEAHT